MSAARVDLEVLLEVADLVLEGHLVLGSLVDYFVQDEVLFTQVSHRCLHFLPLCLPEICSKRLIFRVQVSLPIAHFKDLVDRFFFDLLLLFRLIIS